jgi:ubiquinone/menaquinone biosynthesis C-methylase UbiE
MDENSDQHEAASSAAKKASAKRVARRAGAPQGSPSAAKRAAASKAAAGKKTPGKPAPETAPIKIASSKGTPSKRTPSKATSRQMAVKKAESVSFSEAPATAPPTTGLTGPTGPTGPAAAEAVADPFRLSSSAEAGSEQELAGHGASPSDSVGDDSLGSVEEGEWSTDVESAVARFAHAVGPTQQAIVSPPAEPASAEDVQRAWKDNRLAQVLYHDWEAGTYDEKWSISFDDRCITYARDRFSALVGPEVLRTEPWPYRRSLEIGAGTGFFSLNLRQAGVLDEVHVSDVSAGMVDNAKRNALELGFEVQGAVAGAESLPYDDDTFDVVLGHAVIHHIPDVESALREVLRVLRPGGRFVIAGEPTRVGDWYARRLGSVTWKVATKVTRLPRLREKWAKSQDELDASSRAAALEAVVDLHTFDPEELRAMAERAGAAQVRTQTEELLAAFLGWPVRTFEAAVNPDALGFGWASFAYGSWRRLSALDRLLARALPQSVFYNVGVTGTKPITSEPITSEPITSEPITSEPVSSKPVGSKPVG